MVKSTSTFLCGLTFILHRITGLSETITHEGGKGFKESMLCSIAGNEHDGLSLTEGEQEVGSLHAGDAGSIFTGSISN